VLDRVPQRITARGVCPPCNGTIEGQPGQVDSDGGVDGVGKGVVPACHVEQRRDVDACGVTFSHVGLGRGAGPFGSAVSVVR
jgi:hypothetical protein